ncbi:MAG: hypothetical protein AB1611_11505 [bacterium]
MSKRCLQVLVIVMAILAMAGRSGAATININIYGASAQYLFWNDAADNFLASIGCTNIQQAEDSSKKHGITKGTKGADTYYIRYSSKASFDGIYSCKGQVPPPEVGGQPSCAGNPRNREMADENNTNWATKLVNGLKCVEVTIGASDVGGECFGQYTEGKLKGHYDRANQPYVYRNVGPIDTTGMTIYKPLVVPFGFFANTAIETEVSNLTRLQAVLIFARKAFVWSDFGPTTYPVKDIVACLRHAGSGTHATLDNVVFRTDTWPLATTEDDWGVWFNDGSSDMMRCIEQNGGFSTDTAAAVGYADADQLVGTSSYPHVYALNYMGASAAKENITNCVYDFWAEQHLYECNPNDSVTHPIVLQLIAYASNPANLPASKAAYWATQSEMLCEKANCRAYPQFK